MSPSISVSSSEDKLVIHSEPSTKSWAVLVGCLASGIGMAIYSTDCWLCKIFYFGALLGVGLWYFEDWQEIVFDKTSGRLTVVGKSFFQKYVCSGCPGKSVSYDVDEIVSVHVRDGDDNKPFVVMRNKVTECNFRIYASVIECSQLVHSIQTFLKLDRKSTKSQQPQQQEAPTVADADSGSSSVTKANETATDVVADDLVAASALAATTDDVVAAAQNDDDSSVTSSEESFERVSATDLAEYEAVIESNGDTSSDLSPVSPDDDKEIENVSANVNDGD